MMGKIQVDLLPGFLILSSTNRASGGHIAVAG
jgi:hypothetical protein